MVAPTVSLNVQEMQFGGHSKHQHTNDKAVVHLDPNFLTYVYDNN